MMTRLVPLTEQAAAIGAFCACGQPAEHVALTYGRQGDAEEWRVVCRACAEATGARMPEERSERG